MDANDVLKLIHEYNSHEKEIFDHCADLFISQVRKELEEIYNSKKWAQIVACNQIGIGLKQIGCDFNTFKIEILLAYLMKFGENVHDNYELPTFEEFIESGRYKGTEICGFQCEEILEIQPFAKSLEEKGFGVYVDVDNYELVVTLDIK